MLRTWPPDNQFPPADHSQKSVAEVFRQRGKVVVEAPPGTGKTFLGVYLALCAYRLGWTSKETPALFLTFSRNARVQIEYEIQRFQKEDWLVGDEVKSLKVYNYHAFYFELIQFKAGIWGCTEKLRPASILENRTRLQILLPEYCRENEKILNQASLIFALQRFQIDELLGRAEQLLLNQQTLDKLYEGAIDALRNGHPQYDDFAPLFLNLLEINPDLVEWLRHKYPVVILDEFQDTDIIQWEILQRINPRRLVLLQDRYQMIYEWRGARTERLEKVKNHLSIGKDQETLLTHIHRCSTQADLVLFIQELRSDELLGNNVSGNHGRPWLRIRPVRLPKNRGQIPSENRCLSWLRNSGVIDFHETTAILTRTNFLADYLFNHLRVKANRGFHYRCRWIGSSNNSDEKIRDWIWQLRLVERDEDIRSWLGGLLDELLPSKLQNELNVSFSKEFLKDRGKLLARRQKEELRIIKDAWLQIWGLIKMGNYRSVSLGLRQVIASARGLISDEGHLDPDLVYYLQQVINAVEDFNPDDKQNNWEAFCDHLENRHLRSSFFKLRQVPSGLYILTIHQSKGREFDHVIIPWLSGEGEPQKSKTGGRYYSKLDFCKLEDRKLMYVALTRARKRVTIFFPEEDPSPFLRNWKLI